ncbi:L,D-transpeptidase family protein [Mesorhizobium sp. RP14(2022)]|uniref:L,D-transpeptidase family protein n=1 Tax=Mesorhizobium liriopis TaxID=2953882 RepID=A0ABT1C8K4_9HYPH|nr:L,D-transpeptidase family protein [Mesorhizobium liriopis]
MLRIGAQTFPCALGKGGISSNKREGDGATPLARMRVVKAYFRPRHSLDLMPWRAGVPLEGIERDLGWCDASGDRNYNQPVRLPYPASHEKMARDDRLYDTVLVLDWNLRPAKRGRGSAIFLHLARPGFTPTEGCVAVSRATMRRILPLLRQGSVVQVLR